MREYQYELMRPEEIIEERERLPLIYLPIGPLEWHGPHLPLGTDPLHAREVAIDLGKKLGGEIEMISEELKKGIENLILLRK